MIKVNKYYIVSNSDNFIYNKYMILLTMKASEILNRNHSIEVGYES